MITNKTNMSLPLAIFCAYDDYDYSNDSLVVSATSLLKPTRQLLLDDLHGVNRNFDVSERLASSIGTSIHDGIDKSLNNIKPEVIKELGYSEDILSKISTEQRSYKKFGKYTISGKYDMVYDGSVYDFKTTSVWSYIYGSNDKNYQLQLSIYRVLNPELIINDTGYIEYIFTDWSLANSLKNKDYPDNKYATKPIELLSIEDTIKYIEDKLSDFENHKNNNTLPLCSDEDLWKEPDTYKYYKNPTKLSRATKVYTNQQEAENRVIREGGVVKHYKGGAKRCHYCNHREHCSQYEDMALRGEV